jgi:hypothetical protein
MRKKTPIHSACLSPNAKADKKTPPSKNHLYSEAKRDFKKNSQRLK